MRLAPLVWLLACLLACLLGGFPGLLKPITSAATETAVDPGQPDVFVTAELGSKVGADPPRPQGCVTPERFRVIPAAADPAAGVLSEGAKGTQGPVSDAAGSSPARMDIRLQQLIGAVVGRTKQAVMVDLQRASFRCPDDRISAAEHLLNQRGRSLNAPLPSEGGEEADESAEAPLLGKLFDAPPRVDGRFLPHLEHSLRRPSTAYALRTPGGDFGHLLWLLQVLHDQEPLTQATADLVFRRWLDTPPRRIFHYHTDSTALRLLQTKLRSLMPLGAPRLDLAQPPESVQARLLELLQLPENQGCDWLRRVLADPAQAGLAPEIPRMAIVSYFTMLWGRDTWGSSVHLPLHRLLELRVSPDPGREDHQPPSGGSPGASPEDPEELAFAKYIRRLERQRRRMILGHSGEEEEGVAGVRPETGVSVRLTVLDPPACQAEGWAAVFPGSEQPKEARLPPVTNAAGAAASPIEDVLQGRTEFPLRVATRNPGAEEYRLRQLAEFGVRLRGLTGFDPAELHRNMSRLATAGRRLLPRTAQFEQGDDPEPDDNDFADDDYGHDGGGASGGGSGSGKRIRWRELRWQLQVDETE